MSTSENDAVEDDATLAAADVVSEALQGGAHNFVSKAMAICGVMAVFTVCVSAIMFFITMEIHVWRNGSWPPNVGWGIVCVVMGIPGIIGWQFMGVRKILTSILSSDNTLGTIAKEVVARKLGLQPVPPPQPNVAE